MSDELHLDTIVVRRPFEKLGLHSSSHHKRLLVVIRIHCITAIFLIVNEIFKEQFFLITTIIEFLAHWVSLSHNFKGYSMYLNFLNLNVNDRIFLLKIFITRRKQELVLTELVVSGNQRKRNVITDDGLLCYFCLKDY